MTQKRVVSGIQPTGNLHLGNYLGAIRNWVRMQEEGKCFFFLADLHAISVYNDPAELQSNVRQMAAALLAAGIDGKQSVLFRQADVPAHPELAWLLNGTARIGWLNRMTQFKEKSGKNRDSASVALYAYPVLQAADILLYSATHVPVGEDQKQHLELTRDTAIKFNADFKVDLFTLPEPMIGNSAARVMSLRDGTAKMSKSDPSEMSRIHLTDSVDEIAKKLRKAKTDADPLPETMEELGDRAEARNLLGIYAAMNDQTPQEVLSAFTGQGFGSFKPVLTELVVEKLRPITERLGRFSQDPSEIDRILAGGAARAREAAEPVLQGAYRAMGLRA